MTPRPPAPALRTRLGELFRLRARLCRGCSAPVLATDHRVKYCAACLSTPCKGCGRAGEHTPSCWYVRRPPRLCRACQAPLGPAPPSTRYCETCRADQCIYCGRYAGGHKPGCARVKYTRRVALPYLGIVSVTMLEATYVAHRERAVRLARGICGSEAEDVVQDVISYFLSRLGTLRQVSRSLFLTSVKRLAVQRATDGWHRHHVMMALDELLVVEAKLYRPGKHPYNGTVRLPSPSVSA